MHDITDGDGVPDPARGRTHRPPEARSALIDRVESGDCHRAEAEIVADDPDLATE